MKLISAALTLSIALSLSASIAVKATDLTPAQQEEVRVKSGVWMDDNRKAEALSKQHKFAEAEALYKKVLSEREALGLDTSQEHYNLAWFYANFGKNDLAEEEFKQELAVVEKNSMLDEMHSVFPLQEHAKFLDKIGKKAEAAKLRAKAKAIQADASKPVKLPALKANMTAEEKVEEGKKACEMAKKYYDSELPEKAAVWVGRAIALNPKDSTAFLIRGECESWENKFAKASQTFSTAIQLKPDYSEAYNERGHADVALKQIPKAYADFEKAFELNKKNHDALGSKAKLEDTSGKHKEAIADYTRIIEVAPELSWPYVQRAFAYETIKDYKKAIADYTVLCDRYPKEYDYYEMRGTAYFRANMMKESLDDYNKVVALNPKYTGGYADRAKVYQKIDGKKSARVMADLKKAK
ncbi:MAG TPA: hypothetical protein V6C76_07205 [Drouetiella sp.]